MHNSISYTLQFKISSYSFYLLKKKKIKKTFIKQGLIKLIKSVSNDFIVIQISYFK